MCGLLCKNSCLALYPRDCRVFILFLLALVSLFNGIPTFVGYLMPHPSL